MLRSIGGQLFAYTHSLRATIGSSLLRNGISTVLIKALGMPLAFGLQLVLVRVMNVQEYGVYAFAVSWLAIITLVVALGFDVSYLRFIPQYRVNRQWNYLKGILRRGGTLVSTFSVCTGVLFACLVFLLVEDPSLRLTLLVMCLLFPVRGLNMLRQAALKGIETPFWAFLPERVLRPVMLAGGCVLLYFLISEPLHASSVMALNLFVMVCLLTLGTIVLRRRLPSQLRNVQADSSNTSEWLKVSLPLFIMSGLGVIFLRLDVLMVGFLAGKEPTAVYNAASRTAILMTLFITTALAVLSPRISELYYSNNLEKLQRTISIGATLSDVFTFLLFVPFCLFGEYVLALFGEQYIAGLPALVILAAGYLVEAFTVMANILLRVTGYQKISAGLLASALLLNVLLNVTLIPHYGITGAALATAVSTALLNVLRLLYARKHLGLHITCFAFLKK